MKPSHGKTISVRLDEALYQKLSQIARQEYRTLSAQVFYWLRSCIRAYEQEQGVLSDTVDP